MLMYTNNKNTNRDERMNKKWMKIHTLNLERKERNLEGIGDRKIHEDEELKQWYSKCRKK